MLNVSENFSVTPELLTVCKINSSKTDMVYVIQIYNGIQRGHDEHIMLFCYFHKKGVGIAVYYLFPVFGKSDAGLVAVRGNTDYLLFGYIIGLKFSAKLN